MGKPTTYPEYVATPARRITVHRLAESCDASYPGRLCAAGRTAQLNPGPQLNTYGQLFWRGLKMPGLTHAEATERGTLLRVRSYAVDLDLTGGQETFRSTTRIVFDAHTAGTSTFLDVKPAQLRSVLINGRALDPSALAGGRIMLTGLATENEVVVVADMAYSRACEGLHRYVDPADGRVYVYAFVFIDNAPRVFACFD